MSLLAISTLLNVLTVTRDSGATYFDTSGRMIGVDHVTTSSQAASTGTKNYTIAANRGWAPGQAVKITPTDTTANITMYGTVTSYDAVTGALVINVTSTGSDTTTNKTAWRIGYIGARVTCYGTAPYAVAGLWTEPARTNSCRNGDCANSTNGVIGSGGVLPTGFSIETASGLTTEVIGSGTVNGISYFDLKISGTPAGNYDFLFATTTSNSANVGNTWIQSMWMQIVAGDLTNISSVNIKIDERDAAGALLQSNVASCAVGSATLTRFFTDYTFQNTGAGRATPGMRIIATGAINITLRIAGIQFERVKNNITNGTAQAGSANTITLAASYTGNSTAIVAGYKVCITGGTGAGQTRDVLTWNSGTKVITTSTNWTTNPDATSVYAVYANTQSYGGPSSYLPTRHGTASENRSADVVTVSNFATWCPTQVEGTLFVDFEMGPFYDYPATVSQRVIALHNGSTSDSIRMFVAAPTTQRASSQVFVGNVAQASFNDGLALPAGQRRKSCIGFKLNDFASSFDNALPLTDNSGTIPPYNQLQLGGDTSGAYFGGYIKRVRFRPRKIINANIQAMV